MSEKTNQSHKTITKMKNRKTSTSPNFVVIWAMALLTVLCMCGQAEAATATTIRVISKSTFDGYRISARFRLLDAAGQPVARQSVRLTALFNGHGVKHHCRTYTDKNGYYRCTVASRWPRPANSAEMIVDHFGDSQYERSQVRVQWP